MHTLQQSDPEIYDAIQSEIVRQRDGLEMIASENYTSTEVMTATGCVLTNKYAEGYPGRRYYGGCTHADDIEQLARTRACETFGASHANVQPHSGSQANMAVYLSCLKPGDQILAMDLAHGGHLTHGMRLNFSGKLYQVVSYGVDPDTHRINFDQIAELAKEHKPKLIVAGHSSYPREVPHEQFAEIAKDIGALFMVDMAHYSGLVAAGLHNDPVPVADFVSSTTHKTLRGPRSGFVLCREEHAKALDKAVFPGMQGGPLMHVIAGKAVCFKAAQSPDFKTYAQQVLVNARSLADSLQAGGLSLISGGTDNHLMVADVTSIGLSGHQAEVALEVAGITVNKNVIPFDTRKPLDPSGIRIGTPALTTRGMKEDEMTTIAAWILDVLKNADDKQRAERVSREVRELAQQFPIPLQPA
ncbi:MAG: serine hydroxymethyltransferase [Planctomycetes bacterium]|nr:serine hydroxymethyltransferase [Planctomycetota bacterium]